MITQEKLGIDERINEAFQPISNFWEGLILHEFFGTGIPQVNDVLLTERSFRPFLTKLTTSFLLEEGEIKSLFSS